MEPIPLVRASALSPFLRLLDGIGAPVERRLANARLSTRVIDEPESLIPLNKGLDFLERNAAKEGIPDLGILAGKTTRLSDLGTFGRAIQRSLTLYEAMMKAAFLVNCYNSSEEVWFSRRNGIVFIHHNYRNVTSSGQRYGDQFDLLIFAEIVRLAAGPHWQPAEVRLRAEKREAQSVLEVFEGPRLIDAESCAVGFPASLLTIPLDARHRSDLDRRDSAALERTGPADDFVGSLQQVMATLLRSGHRGAADLAGLVGMSKRTLHRRLAACETTFSELLNQVRFDTAMRLIDDPTIRIIDIAYELGYADAASFSRAFRQWTGQTPTQIREAGRGLDGVPAV